MDHPSNSRLCVLSGTHAGASLDLAPGDYTVGCEDDSSIYLSDWAFAPLTLRVDPNGDHEVRWVGRRVVTISMPSFKAFDFAGTVLSIGAADGDWPERADVMETRKQVRLNPGFLPAVHRPVTRARRSLLSVFGAGLVGAFLIGGLVSALSKQQPSFPSAPQSRQKFVQEVVDAVAPSALRVTVSGNSLTVDGVVSDAEVARRVHDRLVGSCVEPLIIDITGHATDAKGSPVKCAAAGPRAPAFRPMSRAMPLPRDVTPGAEVMRFFDSTSAAALSVSWAAACWASAIRRSPSPSGACASPLACLTYSSRALRKSLLASRCCNTSLPRA
ncbi:hypothetical protein [Variovorax soli]|uniref:hypothetical protein n=1 Tax=Variovorax soli TaxID=376815 RepID=UPI000AB18081|nr:hypothetical protein [Variovorax soli]